MVPAVPQDVAAAADDDEPSSSYSPQAQAQAQALPEPSQMPGPHPRLIIYSQTRRRTSDGGAVSLLPLLDTGATHVIIAAFHLNEDPDAITLNDDHPLAPMYDQLWSEVRTLRERKGIKVLGMLGGAAKGSYERLTGSEVQFHRYYNPLLELLHSLPLDGLDLDIEEPVPLHTPIRLLKRLRHDMGASFILTMAPVATALLPPLFHMPHLSGFSYFDLEDEAGSLVSWYNTQFYCGWGNAANKWWYEAVLSAGWDPAKVVFGLITSPANGSGFVDLAKISDVLAVLCTRYPRFGGVMGWEYFNSEPAGEARPWEWANAMAAALKIPTTVGNIYNLEAGSKASTDPPQLPFRTDDIDNLLVLGFERMQAFAALMETLGNVEMAANILFEQQIESSPLGTD